MDFLWSIPYFLLIVWLLPKLPFFRNSEITTTGIRVLFMVKSLMGIAIILVYSLYYPPESADLFNYFNDAKVLHKSLKINATDYFRMITGINDEAPHLMYYYDQMNFWLKDFNYNLINDNRTVIRFNALVMLFSMKNIFVHTYVINILSLAGLTGIYTFLRNNLNLNKSQALIAVILPPSLLFWGSGLLKEGLLLFAMGLLLYGINRLSRNKNQMKIYILIIIAVALLSISKFYVLLALLPGLISLWLSRYSKKPFLIFAIVHVVLYVSLFVLPYTNYFPDIPQIIAQKQNDFIRFVHSLNHVGSYIETPFLGSDFFTFTVQAVRGALVTLFRPHLFEIHNAAMAPAVLENSITIVLLVMTIFLRNKKTPVKTIYFCASFTIIIFALAGMTTPVLGALVRYKIPAQPFLYGLLLMSIDWKYIEHILYQRSPKIQMLFHKFQKLVFKSNQ